MKILLHGRGRAIAEGHDGRDACGATTLAGLTTRALLLATAIDHRLAHGDELALGRLVAQ